MFKYAIPLFCVFAPALFADEPYPVSPYQKKHWAWKSPERPSLPPIEDVSWPESAVDRFVLARLESAGLRPAERATREQLIRRVTFGLIGLPSTIDEIDAFVNDNSPDAWEKVIDRLLASPHYGERWGRHWLDLVRYADSNGYEHDEVRPNAWRYRDYVIQAFNGDKPYDQFVREQIAGDELHPENPAAVVATGYALLGPDMTDANSKAERRQNTLNDMTDTTGFVFLGLSIGCARCHDHKFEPIPITDYYRFQAFFTPVQFRTDLTVATKEGRSEFQKKLAAYEAKTKPIQDQLTALIDEAKKTIRQQRLAKLSEETQLAHRTPAAKRTKRQKELVANSKRRLSVSAKQAEAGISGADRTQYRKLQAKLRQFDRFKPKPLPVARGLHTGDSGETYVLSRGELNNRGDEVQPGWPIILSPKYQEITVATKPHGRRAKLADWIANPNNPMTARVMVNRLWQYHFGRGIVPTTSDFGIRGKNPTHPELLDWLAVEFVERGWSMKAMHKLMLTSATYQQSSIASPVSLENDPENRLFSRMNRLRLEGEVVRDSLFFLGGELNRKMGGAGVFPPIPKEARQGAKGWKTSPNPDDHVRKSVYIFARRNLRFPFLETFDLPDSNLSCPKRESSTTALQSLTMLNSSDVMQAAARLSVKISSEAKSTDEQVRLAYRMILGRQPAENELRICSEFLQRSPLSELCRALLNTNEFVYAD